MKRLIFILAITVIYSCSHSNVKKTGRGKTNITEKNKNLISFRSRQVMDSEKMTEKTEKEFQQLHDVDNFHFDRDTIRYDTDTIHISFLTCVNACASFEGDIKIHNDSLILKRIFVGDILCMSERIDRFEYVIFNPTNKKFNVKIEN